MAKRVKAFQSKPKKNKKILQLFLLMIPSLLLAMTASIEDNLVIRWTFQIVILLMQFVLVKSMLDSYEGED